MTPVSLLQDRTEDPLDFRMEEDSLGSIKVPAHVLWGAQTERARQNFAVSGHPTGQFGALVRALAMIKLAAARVNLARGMLSASKAAAIEQACKAVIAGQHDDAFPVDAIQGGAGTSTNMNVNEVIANLANEHLGEARGSYRFVHPNDDVNACQSTNDVYPSAIKLSLLLVLPDLEQALASLALALDDRATAFADIVKLGRTQLQDAVPMTLGQEFAAFAKAIRKEIAALENARHDLLEINLGGTAIGTGVNAPSGFGAAVTTELRAISGMPLRLAEDLIEASWDMGAFLACSAGLRRIAIKLGKIANDLRLLSSGPRGGLGEVRLPQMQPGSSIMPGKVNPVIPEMVNQVCFQVIGLDTAVTLAADAGQLQLNAMEPLIAFNLHTAIEMLTKAVSSFKTRCIEGIDADPATCRHHLDLSMAAATVLVPLLGYSRSAALAKQALAENRNVLELALEQGWLKPDWQKTVEERLVGLALPVDLDGNGAGPRRAE